jgi:uncharacterized lipoprotein YmbA
MKKTIYTLYTLTILALLAGCSSSETPVHFYVLEPSGFSSLPLGRTPSIEIVDLEIPQYLERFQIASRKTETQLSFAISHQWAENLRKNVSRTLARNLTNRLSTAAVGTPANRLSEKPQYQLTVYIERFERDPAGYMQLVARWQLIDGESGTTLANRSDEFTSLLQINAKDYPGSVDAMGVVLGELADSIAMAVSSNE